MDGGKRRLVNEGGGPSGTGDLVEHVLCDFRIREPGRKLEEYRKAQGDVREWGALIRQYKDADILDRDMLLRLVDQIEVGEARTVDGQKECK